MLEDVKTALRIKSNDPGIQSEIEDLIESARYDLKIAGVVIPEEEDPLIKRAIVTYAKANYGLDSPNAERFQDSYTMLKQHLSMSGDYNGRNLE